LGIGHSPTASSLAKKAKGALTDRPQQTNNDSTFERKNKLITSRVNKKALYSSIERGKKDTLSSTYKQSKHTINSKPLPPDAKQSKFEISEKDMSHYFSSKQINNQNKVNSKLEKAQEPLFMQRAQRNSRQDNLASYGLAQSL